jgi:hypothetical protein
MYQAYTNPYNAEGFLCYVFQGVPTGSCNTTDQRAASSSIQFNTLVQPWSNLLWLTRHELGHVFGLFHPTDCQNPAVPLTVMFETGCYLPHGGTRPMPTILQADEINWINNTY